MHKCAWLVLLALLTTTSSEAEELKSRYGVVAAILVNETSSSFAISLDSKHLTTIKTDSVSLYRVTPQGNAEYIIIERWKPGYSCHKSYMLLEIAPDKKTKLSPEFAECMELDAAVYLKKGARLYFHPAFLDMMDSYIPIESSIKNHTRYTWKNGKLFKRDVDSIP